jgi:ketosteroid isomerase-like protein
LKFLKFLKSRAVFDELFIDCISRDGYAERRIGGNETTMWRTVLALAVATVTLCNGTARAAAANSENQALSVPVASLAAAVNASQLAFPSDALTADCVVIGSSAPFIWSRDANGGVAAWYAAVVGATDPKTRTMVLQANEHVAVGPAANVNVQGSLGYATFAVTWSAKSVMGKPFTKRFVLAVVERQTDQGWKIAVQSWAVMPPSTP